MTETNPTLSPRQIAAKKAWETMRANKAAGIAPAGKRKAALRTSTAPAPVVEPARKSPLRVTRSLIVEPVEAPAELTAGQKAAESKRLKIEARARIEEEARGVESASPLEDSRMVSMSIADRRIGTGWRPFVVLGIGKRDVLLFQPATLVTLKVERRSFDKFARPLSRTQAPKKTVRRIIRERMEEASRLQRRFSKTAARLALKAVA